MESHIDTIFKELERLRMAVKRHSRIKRQLLILQQELEDQRLRVDKEYQDIVKLEGTTMGELFSKILSNKKETQLEIERQEYLQAVLTFDALVREIEVLTFEEKILAGKVNELPAAETKYQVALKLEEQKLQSDNPSLAIDINVINRRIDARIKIIVEIDEVLLIGNLLISNLDQATKVIKGIKSFRDRSYQFVQRTKEIRDLVASINVLFNKYGEEITDVYPKMQLSLNDFKLRRFVSSFYQRLISDYLSSSLRKDTLHQLEYGNHKVKDLQEGIKIKKMKLTKEINAELSIKQDLIHDKQSENE